MSDTLVGGTAVVLKAALGREIATAFAREGCDKLAICDTDRLALEETQRALQIKFKSSIVEAKVLEDEDESSIAGFFEHVVNKFGRIDFSVNIASHEPPVAGVHEIEESDFDEAFSSNQKSIFLSDKFALGQMIKQDFLNGYETRGSIVNVTSIAGTAALQGMNTYSAGMGAIFGMSKTDAFDYAEDRIRVNVVAPLSFAKKEVASTLDEHPFRRHATPADVANAVVFLSGPRAAFISGVALPVDGGFHLRTGGPPRW